MGQGDTLFSTFWSFRYSVDGLRIDTGSISFLPSKGSTTASSQGSEQNHETNKTASALRSGRQRRSALLNPSQNILLWEISECRMNVSPTMPPPVHCPAPGTRGTLAGRWIHGQAQTFTQTAGILCHSFARSLPIQSHQAVWMVFVCA